MRFKRMIYRSYDDAPTDYTYFTSVSDAEKNRQAQSIHRQPEDAVIRSYEPDSKEADGARPRADAYGTHARRIARYAQPDESGAPPRGYNAMRRMPVYDREAESAAASQRRASSLKIRARDVAIPGEHAQTPVRQPAPPPTPSPIPPPPLTPQPGPLTPPPPAHQPQPPAHQPPAPGKPHRGGASFAAPASPAIPSWYRDAPAGNTTPRRQQPVVQRARAAEGESVLYGDPAPRPAQEAPAPRSRRAERPDTEREEAPAKTSVPWLGMAVCALLIAVVSAWLIGMNLDNQRAGILASRQSAQAAIIERHPLRYRELIEREAAQYNIHPAFVAAIILNESSFDPAAESRVGARGLMQLMEDTAGWINDKLELGGYGFDLMYDAEANVKFGCWYLNYLAGKFGGDPVLVASAFHAGQGTVQNWLGDIRYSNDKRTIALENMMDGPTKAYATRVMDAYAAYKRIFYET